MFSLAYAGFDEAKEACRKGDYAQAYEEFKKLAEQGDARAQYTLGFMYAKGKGVPEDYAEAMKWYRKAAEQGDPNAQDALGWMYAEGKGVAKDYAEAMRWYRKAAEQGYARAQYTLGFMYANGEGVAKDDAEAVKWFRKAAEQGYARAQDALGFMYAKGEGVNIWTISHIISTAVGIVGGLLLLIGPRLRAVSRPRWVSKALSIAGLLAIAWGCLIFIQLRWESSLSLRLLYYVKHFKVVLGCTGLGILITLLISGELFRK